MTPVIEFEDVSKQYNGRNVLSALCLDIYPSDVVGLLGPSGMGKTTILKLVAGLEQPTSGAVRIASKRIAYVFQEPRLFPWKTALENVVLPLKANGMPKKERNDIGMQFLESMGLAEFRDYYPSQLSGGMKQRVSLARAFATNPDILLLDEPFSALDNELRDSLLGMIRKQLARHPMTVLHVSHCPREVARMANRVLMMYSGQRLAEVDVAFCDTLESRPEARCTPSTC